MTVTQITEWSQFDQIVTKADPSTLVILYFHAEWAAPCGPMSSVFESLSEVYAPASDSRTPPAARFVGLDADAFPELLDRFDIEAVPFFVFLRDSTVLKEISGADPEGLTNAIETQLSAQNSGSKSDAEKPAAAGSANTQSSSAGGSNGEAARTGASEEHEETEAELHERLTKLVSAAPVMLFMKGTPAAPSCGFSRQMVGLLRDNQVRFGFFDILKDNSVRQGLKTFSDWPTFPQLYIKGELQGGLDIIKESLADDPDFFKNSLE